MPDPPDPVGPLAFRPARSQDDALVWAWRNAPEVRAVSRRQDAIPWPVHRAWFRDAVASPDRLLWIIEMCGRPVGLLRFDRRDPVSWDVSIVLSSQVRGRGLGSAVLRRAVADLAPLRARTLVASVQQSNEASRRAFLSAGFVETSHERDFLELEHTRAIAAAQEDEKPQ